ncbi:hypothetical protein JYU34_010641 [Plutella xylostella]|uniref:Retrotransposon gag domain-containing protein n=1 Tax=Plutella xylostella TaxID=51655 RepID=A0ABQ7QIS4_PLUXY|nr:hypothetical protein JYU34_010641 [Plutella xylostella]
MISSFCPVTPTAPHVCTDDLLKIAMADDEDPVAGLNPFPSATAAVGSEQRASSVPYHPSATTSEAYFNDPAPDMPEENFQTTCNIENQTTCHGNGNTMPTIENNQANPPSAMWASFLRAMAEGFRANETSSTTPKTVLKKMKPSDVYIPSFDPDDCEFTAAQWCEEIDHHRTQNEWTDYETRNAAFTHLRGRARKWASKSYPLCKTWVEAKERLTRQFATTKRFHDLFRDMVQYTSDKAATYVDYSTSKLAMIDRLEPGWSEANKIEVVISGIVDNQYKKLDLLDVRAQAKVRMDEQACLDKIRFDKGKARVRLFNVGDIVLVEKNPRVNTKLGEKFSNPCKIIEIPGSRGNRPLDAD